MTSKRVFLICLLGLSIDHSSSRGDGWSSSRGGPERDGHRAGIAYLTHPQIVWKHGLGGNLDAQALFVPRQPGGTATTMLAAGGRLDAKRWDDARIWRSDLLGVDRIMVEADLDADGEIDAIFAQGNLAGPLIAAFSPNGTLQWSTSDSGRIASGVRLVDVDGDGRLDLYIPAPQDNDVPRFRVFRFPSGPASGELLYSQEIARDYVAGFNDVIGEFDGMPGLEIVAQGHTRMYVYDAATGELKSTTENLGPLPYGRATMRPIDLDGDGTMELVLYSNEAWAAPNNRRHVTLFGWSPLDNSLVVRWQREVADHANDRVAFADNSTIDLDGDGQYEVVFGVYSAATGRWTTEVRDALTGNLLAAVDQERFEGVLPPTSEVGGFLFTHKRGSPLRAYRFSRDSGVTLLATLDDRSIALCREQPTVLAERERMLPCRVTANGVADAGLVLRTAEADSDRTRAIHVVNLRDPSISTIGSFDAGHDYISTQARVHVGPAVIAVALTRGVVLPLDERLREVTPPQDDVGYRGVRFGSVFSGTDLASFPLVSWMGPNERILAIGGGGRVILLDPANSASIGGGVETVWSAVGAERAVIDDNAGYVVLFDPLNGVRAVKLEDGETAWRVDNTLSLAEGRLLQGDPLLVEHSGGRAIWFHRRDNNRGAYDLTALSTTTGELVLSQTDLDFNNSGWKRLSLSHINGEPIPLSGPLSQVWRYDLLGAPTQIAAVEQSMMSVAIPGSGDPPHLLITGWFTLSRLDEAGQTVWSIPQPNGTTFRFGAFVNAAGETRYGATSLTSPSFKIIQTETGAVLTERFLVGGVAVEDLSDVEHPPSLSNVTSVDDLTGMGNPAFVVGSSDGFIYAVSATDGSLIWSLDCGAPVGEVVPVDWDGDGQLELVASTADGTLIGIDSYTGDAPAWVHDTDGSSADDIDEIHASSTLFATWAPVSGATDYQVAVFRNDGVPISNGFRSVGPATSVVLNDLPLENGTRYVISVRAISALGTSPDTPSDGVTVIKINTPPTHPTGGCCSASDVGAGTPLAETIVLVLAYLWWRRRDRRRVM